MLDLALPILLIVSLGIPVGAALFLRSIGRKQLQEQRWLGDCVRSLHCDALFTDREAWRHML
jgi:hypothetical protein